MTIDEAKEYFKSAYRICQLLGIKRQNFCQWNAQGYIPLKHQVTLEVLSNGKLTAKIDDIKFGQHAIKKVVVESKKDKLHVSKRKERKTKVGDSK